jgi:peptidoglycan/LPS O-acetylase OafA/YrhL
MLGVMFFKWHLDDTLSKYSFSKSKTLSLAVFLVLLPSIYAAFHSLFFGGQDELRLVMAYPVAMAIFLAIFFLKPPVLLRVLEPFGKISYSIYLNHIFVMAFTLWLAGVVGVENKFMSAEVLMVGNAVLTILASILTYRIVEKPFIDFSKRPI